MRIMRSRVAEAARKDLILQAKKMTPAQRLQAYADLCRLTYGPPEAGKSHRAKNKKYPRS